MELLGQLIRVASALGVGEGHQLAFPVHVVVLVRLVVEAAVWIDLVDAFAWVESLLLRLGTVALGTREELDGDLWRVRTNGADARKGGQRRQDLRT